MEPPSKSLTPPPSKHTHTCTHTSVCEEYGSAIIASVAMDQGNVTSCFQEVDCLQINLEHLEQRCRWAVGNFTEDEDADPQLDKILMKACTPMIKHFCKVFQMGISF